MDRAFYIYPAPLLFELLLSSSIVTAVDDEEDDDDVNYEDQYVSLSTAHSLSDSEIFFGRIT